MVVRGELAIARFSGGGSRQGSVKNDGAFYLQMVAADGKSLIFSGSLKGKSGRGAYHVKGAKCGGTFTASQN